MENKKLNMVDLTDKEVLDKYLKDETNKANHLKIAELLETQFKKQWFTIRDILAKTRIKNLKEAHQMMMGLSLFGFAISEEHKRIVRFKIVLSDEEKLKVLEGHKRNHIRQIELLDAEIENIIARRVK